MLARFREKVKTGETALSFNALVPEPNGVGDPDAWAGEHWGTKWDAVSVGVCDGEDRLDYWFETAWSPPLEWLAAVAKRFPKLRFTLEYGEPGFGLLGLVDIEDDVERHAMKD